jgi:hypothetical protein
MHREDAYREYAYREDRQDWMPAATLVDIVCAWCAAALCFAPIAMVL